MACVLTLCNAEARQYTRGARCSDGALKTLSGNRACRMLSRVSAWRKRLWGRWSWWFRWLPAGLLVSGFGYDFWRFRFRAFGAFWSFKAFQGLPACSDDPKPPRTQHKIPPPQPRDGPLDRTQPGRLKMLKLLLKSGRVLPWNELQLFAYLGDVTSALREAPGHDLPSGAQSAVCLKEPCAGEATAVKAALRGI